MKRGIALLLAVILLCGCGTVQNTEDTASIPEPDFTQGETEPIASQPLEQEAQALAEAPPPAPSELECTAPGTQEERCDSAVIDYSNTSQGYVMAQFFGQTEKRLKLRISGPTTVYTYDLPREEWTIFPLSDGDGEYKVTLYQNTTGSKYAAVLSVTFPVALEDEFAPFLRPNQYVDYREAPYTMLVASMLCQDLTHPLEKVAAVYDYVIAKLEYDFEKAETVQSGYLPVLDEVLASGKGICFDYAAMMAAMLRSQDVPCKLIVGYAGTVYHAWISVWTEEDGWVDGVIFFDGHAWKRMDPTFASYGQSSDEILRFIESGNYVTKYQY